MPDPESAALLQIPLARLDQPQRPLRAPTEAPELQQLADSVRACGILNPLIVDLLPLDAGGHIPVDIRMRTALPGLFAAGDIRQHSAAQLAASAGDGATAAISARRYLESL